MDPDDLAACLIAVPRFFRDAACLEYPDVEFFPDRGQSSAPAKAVCARCSVRTECLAFALDLDIRDGVWGGTSPKERRPVRSA